MTTVDQNSTSIWQALDAWASNLKPWQRAILAHAITSGRLTDGQLDEIYLFFLQEIDLTEQKEGSNHVALAVSGRPASVLFDKLRLDRIDGLIGINALPAGAALTFGQGLTVIYGQNGAGKSGFARLFANACFSRHKPEIHGNIYDVGNAPPPSATFHVAIAGNEATPLAFTKGAHHEDLQRISFFDLNVARRHVSETAAFEFKPAGFDVFPEMARAYSQLGLRLDAAIASRTQKNDFGASFIGNPTAVSRAMMQLGPDTGLDQLESLAIYGAPEVARLAEVDKQRTALKANSTHELQSLLKQADDDVEKLNAQVELIGVECTIERCAARNRIAKAAHDAKAAASVLGSDQFRRPFFKAVETSEWLAFAKTAHALARKEGSAYPEASDHCLLCERPFDDASFKHVTSLLAFVESDAQIAVERALADVATELASIGRIDLSLFAEGSRVREHVHKLDPTIEAEVAAFIARAKDYVRMTSDALEQLTTYDARLDAAGLLEQLHRLRERIKADLSRLSSSDTRAAIAALDVEHETLRHREVLSQLMPRIREFVAEAKWCARAEKAKSSLNPRHITNKENELFAQVVGDTYRLRFRDECGKLDCNMPVELLTSGQKGKTVRNLEMPGGYEPEKILSEGEQRAVALADFLTEVALNPVSAAIILDDPVTSQDHQRKRLIAKRLFEESRQRQVVVFTHDLPFLNELMSLGNGTETVAHWIERDGDGRPGQITLNDAPATTRRYDNVEIAREYLKRAKANSGSTRHEAITKGMGALRRTIEEAVAKRLFQGVIPRWSDRVIVTGITKIAWDQGKVDQLAEAYEDISGHIDAHSHTDEAMGAPPEPQDLETRIGQVEKLISSVRAQRVVSKSAAAR
jgi:hypothetical protein